MSELRLKVAASTIDGKGIAKLDSESFRKLKLDDSNPVLVTYGTKTIELAAKADMIFADSTIRIMKPDMEALRVEAGMEVAVAKKNGAQPEKKQKARKGKKGKTANAASLDRF